MLLDDNFQAYLCDLCKSGNGWFCPWTHFGPAMTEESKEESDDQYKVALHQTFPSKSFQIYNELFHLFSNWITTLYQ